MLYRIIAAFFLLPASFIVFGREWFSSLRLGPWYFFGKVIKAGPQLVRKRGRLFNLLVFYPMRAGIEIVHRRDLKLVMCAALRVCLRPVQRQLGIPSGTVPDVDTSCDLPPAPPLPPLSLESLVRMVQAPSVQVLSLDIFDTLLTRPVVDDPRDIFHLVAARVDDAFDLDFVALRWHAEKELGDPYATLDDIYAHIQRRHGLSPELAARLKKEEMLCERTLLQPRPDMLELCRAAQAAGKRIIAVSDMYLPSSFLLEVLHEKGFAAVGTVYVSTEHKARKSDAGALFDIMLRKEQVAAANVLHMGDHIRSDVAIPLSKGMAAVHIPSVRQMLRARGGDMAAVLVESARQDPLWGLLLGQALDQIFARPERSPETLDRCPDTAAISRLALGPLVTALCLKARNIAMHEGYPCVYYASRDGWLPSRVHAVLQEKLGGPEGIYFHAGRRAYFPFLADSFIEYARTRKLAADLDSYTLEDLLRGHFSSEADQLLALLTKEELDIPFCKQQQRCLSILERIDGPLSNLMEIRKERARRYYASVFPSAANRFLVFDMGYSGSISIALSTIAGKPFDKLYCWQNETNQTADAQNGTKTFLLMQKEDYLPYHLILEEMFSPCSGGVVDFDEQGHPCHEIFMPAQPMREALDAVHTSCLEYVQATIDRFGQYSPLLASARADGALEIFCQWFQKKPLSNRAALRDIVFPDPVYCDRLLSLEDKLDSHLAHATVFTATGFDDAANVLPLPSLFCSSCQDLPRIGLHIHIYNGALAQEFSRYLQQFPVPFDVFVTHVKTADRCHLQTLFNQDILPLANAVTIVQTPNRGRDVAPWLSGVGQELQKYDLCCHVHAKESVQMGFGPSWRAYLLDNLLRPDAVRMTLAAFAKDPLLGCVFPSIYTCLRDVMLHVAVPLYGSDEEYRMITGLLTRMGLPATYGRNEQFFSGGTMFWYRPQALQPLLGCDLRFEDFPEEPIGVGGTLAHALERVPPLVCTRRGYRVRSLTCFPCIHYIPERFQD
ncbi:rhamnan synthesis F family protein [uncultured Desulfovibrio sp.]|uniref:rhamnan synthesis F family protein n=1 Tax=uncultured Desulfovibrio sp. TaxID=167968 RepID=UPI0028049343|nr:rhamnan synthesis F family protein [uncultured Desulfovibrio sp.]